MSNAIIAAEALSKEFKLGQQTVKAVDEVSFTIERGEMVSIVGPSGSGKSTLLGLIGGLDTPTAGRIAIDGVEISQLNERKLTDIRNEKIGFVFFVRMIVGDGFNTSSAVSARDRANRGIVTA